MLFKILFISVFVAGSTFLLIKENASTPRILVLHSYSSDYSWTRNIDRGIRKVLNKEHVISVRWHYMDTKNHPENYYKKKIAVVSKRIIEHFKPTVIIAVDDDAQEYVAKHYNNDPKIKIVFSGVNGTREQYGYDKANNVTGILERAPLEGIINTLQQLEGTKKEIKIVHIGDHSETVTLDDDFFHSYQDWKNVKLLPSMLVSTFDEWKSAIHEAGKIADYIIISNYRKIYKTENSEEKIKPKAVIEWTMNNAKKPIIGTNIFVFEDGAHLAIATSPYEQGEVAAEFALKIIKEGKLAEHTETKQFVVGLDEKSTIKNGQFEHLPKVYSAYAWYSKTLREISTDKIL